MAGDWIKMRGNLWDDPRIAGLADTTGVGEATIIGGLYWLWATADQHTEDGFMQGMTLKSINRKTGIKGFAEALVIIGWLEESEGGLIIPRFEEHNGASAKNRAQTARRVAKSTSKTNAPSVSDVPSDDEITNAPTVSDALARVREEKEVNNPPTPRGGFVAFWDAYPKKIGKGAAEKAFAKAPINGHLAEVLTALDRQKQSDQWQRDGGQYVPNPATWLNQRRWEDGDPLALAERADWI